MKTNYKQSNNMIGEWMYFTMDEVVWPEKGSSSASSYTVHGARLKVNQQGSGHIFTTWEQNRFLMDSLNSIIPSLFISPVKADKE